MNGGNYMSDTELWTTNVGSHMWKMNHENSDTDLFQVYLTDTKELLKGNFDYNHSSSSSSNGKLGKDKVEIVKHELQKVINEVINGNVNFLWGVMSPIVLNETSCKYTTEGQFALPYPFFSYDSYLDDLRSIVMANPSKGIYNSTHGLAIGNKKKYLENPDIDSIVKQKKMKIIWRTCMFGINYLNGYGFRFDKPAITQFAPKDIDEIIIDLDSAYKNSSLPEKPDQAMFKDYLYYIRTAGLQ